MLTHKPHVHTAVELNDIVTFTHIHSDSWPKIRGQEFTPLNYSNTHSTWTKQTTNTLYRLLTPHVRENANT